VNALTASTDTTVRPVRRGTLATFGWQLFLMLTIQGVFGAIPFGLFLLERPIDGDVFRLFTAKNDTFMAICLVVAALTVCLAASTAKTYNTGRSAAARDKKLQNLALAWLISFVALGAILVLTTV